MSAVKPRLAVAYHFFKDFDTTGAVYERIRQTYDGPLDLAEDFMVWNVTKDKITTRMAIVEEATWSPPWTMTPAVPQMEDRKRFEERLGTTIGFSEFTKSGFWNVDDVLKPIYKNASDKFGREFKYPEGGDKG